MSIWIRSQDKNHLISANEIWAVGTEIRASHNSLTESFWEMGSYKTEAETIQVLDMIQENILNCTSFTITSTGTSWGGEYYVFKMPPAGFSELEAK